MMNGKLENMFVKAQDPQYWSEEGANCQIKGATSLRNQLCQNSVSILATDIHDWHVQAKGRGDPLSGFSVQSRKNSPQGFMPLIHFEEGQLKILDI